ncbi:MAG: hypothetical protein IH840_17805 [Candidatus Heimdallarchaeota archaeon]|nr:hypothetical protein [Candidatus Heimdallarchaeota archaeon]
MVCCIFILISEVSQAEIDSSKIGVLIGDEFHYIVSKVNYTGFLEDQSRGYYVLGSTFIYRVINITLSSTNSIEMQRTTDSGEIISQNIELDNFGYYVVFTDWSFWITYAEAQIEAADDGVSISYLDNEEEFYFKETFLATDISGATAEITMIYIYDKEHGVLNYYEFLIEQKGGAPEDEGKANVSIQRVENELQSDKNQSIFGFSVIVLLLPLIFYLLQMKSSKNI